VTADGTGKKVFLDLETTGLELHHDAWELAWAVEDGPVQVHQVPHDLRNADPDALELNGYYRRANPWKVNPRADLELRRALTGATLVAANPTFDAIRLQLRWGVAPWHYRVVDVSAMSIPVLGMKQSILTGLDGKPMTVELPKGLWDITNELRDDHGIEVPLPNHTAKRDVEALRAVYHGLMSLAAGQRAYST